jgi:antitoxin CptB
VASGGRAPLTMDSSALEPRELNRLRWRCRRGLLENDLIIERFFARRVGREESHDLLLARREPGPGLADDDVRDVLAALRRRH